jgi:hypothetical protein
MDDTSRGLPEGPPPSVTSPKAITTNPELNAWKSRTNDSTHLEAQRRSLEFYIGEYLFVRRAIWSEYGAWLESRLPHPKTAVEADAPASRLVEGVRTAEGNRFGESVRGLGCCHREGYSD